MIEENKRGGRGKTLPALNPSYYLMNASHELEVISEQIARANHVCFFTGAGISVPSGIPDFRSPTGIWATYDINEYGYLESFMSNPEKVWGFFLNIYKDMSDKQPNQAHVAITRIQQALGADKVTIVTQNIDGLHEKSGSDNVLALHGSMNKLHCVWCGFEKPLLPLEELKKVKVPSCDKCGKALKPKIVLFGETLDPLVLQAAFTASKKSDVVVGVGTSLEVSPANYIFFGSEGVKVLFNLEPVRFHTEIDYFIRGDASQTLPLLAQLVEEKVKG